MAAVLHLYEHCSPFEAPAMLSSLRRYRPGDCFARVGGDDRGDLPVPDCVIRHRWSWRLTAAAGIRALADQRKADVIHCWGAALADAAAATGRPTLVSLFRPPNAAARRALRPAVATGAELIASSQTLRNVLGARGWADAPIHVVAPARNVEDVTDQERRRQARRRLDLPANAAVLLAPQMHERDGTPGMAVWAMGILHFAGAPFHVVCPGAGPEQAKARRLATDPGLDEYVHLPALPPPEAAGDLWASGDILLLQDPEGFGLAAAAAATAAGMPIIAADAGELAAALTHEQTALLVPPATPRLLSREILRLHEQPQLAARLAEGAAGSLAHLTDVTAMVKRMESLYEQAIARRRRPVAAGAVAP